MPCRALITIIVFVAGLIAAAAPAGAQSAADVFNDQVLHDVRLSINSRDLRDLRARYLENVYYPADLVWQGVRVRNVAVRSRGTGSRNPGKLGLLVDFDHYTKGQKSAGLSGLVLDNAWQDPSLMRETLAMKVFRRMGQPAPREAFCRLFINNQYQGLYVMVEPIDPIFAAAATGEANGYLFEYHYRIPWFTEDLGDAFDIYKMLFEPQNHELESDTALYGPIRDWLREANGPDDAVWRERVDQYLDLPQVMTHIAIENVLAENDGILGYAGVNNFYLYRYAGTTRHRLLPWDKDFSFTSGFQEASILRQGLENFPLFQRAWGQADLRAIFLDVADQVAHAIGDDDWLLNEIERTAALIGPAVLEDTHKQYSDDEFTADVDFLRSFAATRSALVQREVEGLRQPPADPSER